MVQDNLLTRWLRLVSLHSRLPVIVEHFSD